MGSGSAGRIAQCSGRPAVAFGEANSPANVRCDPWCDCVWVGGGWVRVEGRLIRSGGVLLAHGPPCRDDRVFVVDPERKE